MGWGDAGGKDVEEKEEGAEEFFHEEEEVGDDLVVGPEETRELAI